MSGVWSYNRLSLGHIWGWNLPPRVLDSAELFCNVCFLTAPPLRHQRAIGWLRVANHVEGSHPWARSARSVIAKSVFQVHGVDDAGAVVMRESIGRARPSARPKFLPRT